MTFRRKHRQRRLQGCVDIRTAAGEEAVRKTQSFLHGLFVCPLQFRSETFDGRVVGDDVERVRLLKPVQEVLQSRSRLFDFLAVHAAGPVEDEDDRLRNRLAVVTFQLGTGEQQEIAIFAVAGPVRNDVHPDEPVLGAVHQPEIVRSLDIFQSKLADRGFIVGAVDADFVRRAVDRADLVGRVDPHRHVEIVDGFRGVLVRADREQQIDEPVVLFQQLLVADLDGSFGIRRNWKDARLEQALPHVLQQSRVFSLPHDGFVGRSCFFFLHQSAGEFLAVDQQSQLTDRRVGRQGEHDLSLNRLA